MKPLYKYYKNSNTGEIVYCVEYTETQIKNIPVYFYSVEGKEIGQNITLVGFVEISEKTFNREKRKTKK